MSEQPPVERSLLQRSLRAAVAAIVIAASAGVGYAASLLWPLPTRYTQMNARLQPIHAQPEGLTEIGVFALAPSANDTDAPKVGAAETDAAHAPSTSADFVVPSLNISVPQQPPVFDDQHPQPKATPSVAELESAPAAAPLPEKPADRKIARRERPLVAARPAPPPEPAQKQDQALKVFMSPDIMSSR